MRVSEVAGSSYAICGAPAMDRMETFPICYGNDARSAGLDSRGALTPSR
jgi:hypothetical protein